MSPSSKYCPKLDFWATFFHQQFGSNFNHCGVSGPQMYTKFGELMKKIWHYAVQGHSRSLISVPMESSYATSYLWRIGLIFAVDRGAPL